MRKNIKNNLQVYNIVVNSEIVHGLAPANMTQTNLSRLTTFHLKGLRQTLKITTTYIDIENTSVNAIKTAEHKINN